MDDDEQLGNGAAGRSPLPVQVASDADAITAGFDFTCMHGFGIAYCWGGNGRAQIGTGTTANQSTPQQVMSVPGTVVGIGAAHQHVCARTSNRSLYCWGANSEGQLGDGRVGDQGSAGLVMGIANVADVGGGVDHTCARRDDGRVYCWGRNLHGQLGDSTRDNNRFPVAVAVPALRTLDVGAWHACGVAADGATWCWGWNGLGQLGDGTMTLVLAPRTTSFACQAASAR
jgi:alpha-tubulin suppressor-like RCC1 family protein